MDCKKSNLSDSPKTKFLKISVNIIAPILTHIINCCIQEGVFPKSLKIAEVVPIFKSGSKTLCNNYRPISLLSPFTKIVESYLYNEINDFLSKNKVLYNLQYGFREKSSTELAVSQITDDLSDSIEKGMINCCIFLDLAKAFNTVNHEILLHKLEYYGIRGITLELMKSFLSNRQQLTRINNHKSSAKLINSGVPQGSILGPLLFLRYINDIAYTSDMKVRLYADDACLSLEHRDPIILEQKTNYELKKIYQWLENNKLITNVSK